MSAETASGDGIILMGDPRVTAIPVSDNGEELIDVRDHGLRVSRFRADDTGDFAFVRAGLAARLRQASDLLPRRTSLLIIEGYRPPALQQRYFDEYHASLPCVRLARAATRSSCECSPAATSAHLK